MLAEAFFASLLAAQALVLNMLLFDFALFVTFGCFSPKSDRNAAEHSPRHHNVVNNIIKDSKKYGPTRADRKSSYLEHIKSQLGKALSATVFVLRVINVASTIACSVISIALGDPNQAHTSLLLFALCVACELTLFATPKPKALEHVADESHKPCTEVKPFSCYKMLRKLMMSSVTALLVVLKTVVSISAVMLAIMAIKYLNNSAPAFGILLLAGFAATLDSVSDFFSRPECSSKDATIPGSDPDEVSVDVHEVPRLTRAVQDQASYFKSFKAWLNYTVVFVIKAIVLVYAFAFVVTVSVFEQAGSPAVAVGLVVCFAVAIDNVFKFFARPNKISKATLGTEVKDLVVDGMKAQASYPKTFNRYLPKILNSVLFILRAMTLVFTIALAVVALVFWQNALPAVSLAHLFAIAAALDRSHEFIFREAQDASYYQMFQRYLRTELQISVQAVGYVVLLAAGAVADAGLKYFLGSASKTVVTMPEIDDGCADDRNDVSDSSHDQQAQEARRSKSFKNYLWKTFTALFIVLQHVSVFGFFVFAAVSKALAPNTEESAEKEEQAAY
ncbi:hypothetical protein HDU96_003432, partial [Phlyctochytrium bullatum]